MRRQTAISAIDVQPKALLRARSAISCRGSIAPLTTVPPEATMAIGRCPASRSAAMAASSASTPHPEGVIDRDQAEILAADTQECDGLRNETMHLFRSVDDAGPRACLIRRNLRLARHRQRHQVCGRAAAAQAAFEIRAADRVRQPADHGLLDRSRQPAQSARK